MLNNNLLDLIICPVTGGNLKYDTDTQELISEDAGLAFPIEDGIPIMLVDKARNLNNKEPQFPIDVAE